MSWYDPFSWFHSGGHEDPHKFTPLPVAQSPVPGGAGGAAGPGSSWQSLSPAQQAAFQNAFSVAGINIPSIGDVWDGIQKLLPKNGDGSIDWGKLGSDIVGWVKSNYKGIVDVASAYSQYQRQQQADKWTKEALDLAKQSYADKAPLRVAGQSGMLNPQSNAPDLSSLKSKVPTPTVAPLPVAGSRTNLNNANGIAAGGSGNPFAPKSPAGPAPLPVAGGSSTPGMPSGGGYGGPPAPSGIPLGGGVSITPRTPTPLPIASGTPQNPQMPAHYLQNGLDTDASGNATPGGYNALSDLYKQLGTSPGSVGDPRILAMAKANPKLIDALPVADAETLRRTMASVGA